jgi:hypothetical protein
VLQKITGGFRHGMFTHSREERLRQFVHHEALIRAGLPWPPPREEEGVIYWSRDKKQQDRNRQIYHGLRLRSLHVINKLIDRVLREAADQDALKVARRFAFRQGYRESIYRAGAKSRRALQLAEAFPVLALAVYCPNTARHQWSGDGDYSFAVWEAEVRQYEKRVQEAIDLVERGARLREVAAVMRIPMALRRIKPGAAHLAVACHNPEWVISSMPDSLPRMRTWLRALCIMRTVELAPTSRSGRPDMHCRSLLKVKTRFIRSLMTSRTGCEPVTVTMGTNSLCVHLGRPCRCGPSRSSAANGTRPSRPI